MAEKKKSKGAGASNKASATDAKAAPAKEAQESPRDAHDAHDAPAPGALAHAAHGPDAHGAHAAHGHKPNVREYIVIFFVLFALTVIEVAVAQIPGISKTLMAIALIGLAFTKAAIVALYYMHLKHETRILKLTVAIPLATPAFYALVLIAEGAWRLARW